MNHDWRIEISEECHDIIKPGEGLSTINILLRILLRNRSRKEPLMERVKKTGLRCIAVFLCISLIIAMTVCVYADEYYDIRDGDISMTFPDGWEVTEIDPYDSNDKPYEHIVNAKAPQTDDPNGKLQLDMYFYCDVPSDDEYIYLSGDEAAAMDYYDKYGELAIADIVYKTEYEQYGDVDLSCGEAEFFDGEWDGFLRVPVDVTADVNGDGKAESYRDLVYITASTTDNENYVVSKILVFHNDGDFFAYTKWQETSEDIADEFYDYDYDNNMTGDGADYSGDYVSEMDIGEIIERILSAVVPLLAIASIVVALVRKLPGKSGKRVNRRKAANNTDMQTRPSVEKEKPKKPRKPEFAKMPVCTNDAEQRYMESLKTLYKSGLLTRSEMNEMIEKHQRRYHGKGGR